MPEISQSIPALIRCAITHNNLYGDVFGEDDGDLKNTDYIMENTFWVGVYPGMTKEKLQRMADVIGEVVEININFSEKCIVIDSGHGGADPGKVGVAGTNEKEINLAIAKKLQERLEDAQINVIMTRDTDDDLSVESDKSKKEVG